MSDDLTYGSYLRIPELLSLQRCRSVDPETGRPEHDETLFIVIHQVYELWFKQVLHELDELCRHLDADAPSKGTHQLKRVLKILKTLVAQLDVLETMTPLEFASFRPFLESASGFQSAQFRELELLLGQFDVSHLDHIEHDPEDRERLERRLREPTVWDAFRPVPRPQRVRHSRLGHRARRHAPARAFGRGSGHPGRDLPVRSGADGGLRVADRLRRGLHGVALPARDEWCSAPSAPSRAQAAPTGPATCAPRSCAPRSPTSGPSAHPSESPADPLEFKSDRPTQPPSRGLRFKLWLR